MPNTKNAFKFREAVVADIPGMHEVRTCVKENILSNPDLISYQNYEEMLLKNGKGWVCEADNKIAGFAIADLSNKIIWALFVAPQYEGKGIGKKLHNLMLNWCLQHADNWQLSTDPETRAEKFYKKAGWQKKGLTKSGEQIFEYHKLKIRNAGENDLITIQQIAEETWPVAYAKILSAEQMRYMLDKMYSLQALENQLKKGHKFLLAEINNETIGFASYELNYENSESAKLHKLYVLPQKQGLQAGNALLDEVIIQSKKAAQKSLLLNVNRYNTTVKFYKRKGFHIIKEEDINIGNNYFMNDYVMELPFAH